MLLLFKSIYTEGNTEPQKRKKKFNPPPPGVESSMSLLLICHTTTEPLCFKKKNVYMYIQKAWQGNYPNSVVTPRVLWFGFNWGDDNVIKKYINLVKRFIYMPLFRLEITNRQVPVTLSGQTWFCSDTTRFWTVICGHWKNGTICDF